MTAIRSTIEESQLRARIGQAAAELPGESWSTDELRGLADFLEAVAANRRREDRHGNVVWLADRR